jgi:hypothetical protein
MILGSIKPPTWKHHRMPNLHNSRCGNVQNTKCWYTVGGARVPQVPQPFFGAIPTLLAFEKIVPNRNVSRLEGKTMEKWWKMTYESETRNYILPWTNAETISSDSYYIFWATMVRIWENKIGHPDPHHSNFFLRSMYCFHQQIDKCCIGKTCEQSVRPETEFMPLVSDSV